MREATKAKSYCLTSSWPRAAAESSKAETRWPEGIATARKSCWVDGSSSIMRIFSDIRLASGTSGFRAGQMKLLFRIEQRNVARKNADGWRVEWVKATRRVVRHAGRHLGACRAIQHKPDEDEDEYVLEQNRA